MDNSLQLLVREAKRIADSLDMLNSLLLDGRQNRETHR